ncbi:MAG TPA: DnaB-like helicase C-terminal domain-containing protein [Flavobacteriales bacterium]|nr:DnaB-like helicase C-terminal domain-containing protein [Flavobacteriales bacterium]HNU57109.1 DnaB-like helicase C-terminal domain-containing protein [Flavobacteriales bacterium]
MSSAPKLQLVRATPSAPEVERAVLGALLLTGEAWPKCVDLLHAELFHDEPNRQIYRIAHELWSKGGAVDILTVSARLRSEGLLDSVGGALYVSQLINGVNSTANLEYHARILIECHIQRRLIAIGSGATESAYTTADALSLLDTVSASVSDLYAYTQPTSLISAADGVTDLTDAKPGSFYTFGIPELDALATFQPGLPHVLAGRPGIGKSIVSVHVMWHLTQAGNVLLFSPEMTVKQVQARIVASECGVPYSTILRATMSEQERDMVASCIIRIGDRLERLKIDPSSGITPEQIRVRTERALKTSDVIAFGVDHLHKMSSGDRRVDREETARVSQCMEGLTEVAKRTNLPALVACQLNRQVESRTDKRPKLSDLKQTGKIEEDAALVVLLYRDGYYQEHPPMDDRMELAVGKNRDGATGTAFCPCTPAFNRMGVPFTPSFNPRKGFHNPDNRNSDEAPF